MPPIVPTPFNPEMKMIIHGDMTAYERAVLNAIFVMRLGMSDLMDLGLSDGQILTSIGQSMSECRADYFEMLESEEGEGPENPLGSPHD